jgi:uncharacterized protein
MKTRPLEISCPIYGFVTLEGIERKIIESESFQRLRRIRQLGWTDVVFPGAMHTRFEHSLGVMHMATRMFDEIVARSKHRLSEELGFNPTDYTRWRKIVRLAALLHDLGHGPFSHVSEKLFPVNPSTKEYYQHEDYSIAAIRYAFGDLLEEYPEIIDLISDGKAKPECLLWRQLVSGQIDADRMDYLLRDAHHVGVPYGRYDWQRIVSTIDFLSSDNGLRIGVRRGGRHAAESLLIARYMMFNCVYNHRTRVIADFHVQETLKEMLSPDVFPPPTEIEAYLDWDDWKFLGCLKLRGGGEHGQMLRARRLYRQVWTTPELPSAEELITFKAVKRVLEAEGLDPQERGSSGVWLKVGGDDDILVEAENDDEEAVELSKYSNLLGRVQPSKRHRLFVPSEHREAANARLSKFPLKRSSVTEVGFA